MSVCWGPGRSKSFCVSNGVRQGGVLSPFLFSVYMDGLIEMMWFYLHPVLLLSDVCWIFVVVMQVLMAWFSMPPRRN